MTRPIIKKIDQIIVILKEMADEKEVGEYAEELALYTDSAAPDGLKEMVLEKGRITINQSEFRWLISCKRQILSALSKCNTEG